MVAGSTVRSELPRHAAPSIRSVARYASAEIVHVGYCLPEVVATIYDEEILYIVNSGVALTVVRCVWLRDLQHFFELTHIDSMPSAGGRKPVYG